MLSAVCSIISAVDGIRDCSQSLSIVGSISYPCLVIIFTVIIRLALWPVVKKQLHHQKAMRDLQPETTKVKQKAKGDKQKESQLMVELFKEKQINPFASIGLAFLQFPILIALFFVLQHIGDAGRIEEVAYPFIANLDIIKGIIAEPSSFQPSLFGIVDMAKPNIVIALFAGLAQYVQAKQLMPKNTSGADKKSSFAFNATLIFPILTVAIGVRFPSALALYWFTSSAVAVIQQHIVLNDEVSLIESVKKIGRRK